MMEIIIWTGIIMGGCAAYQMLGGKPAPKEENDNCKEKVNNYDETYDYFMKLTLD